MNSHIQATNPSARCLLKWMAGSVNRTKVTEVLKERVTRIECEGDSSSFEMRLVVNGGYAKRILELSYGELETRLANGFQEQSGIEMKKLSFVSE